MRFSPDGALKPDRAEYLAWAWADGFRGGEAWEMSGGGAASYRSRIETNEVFRERVGQLEAEKKNLEQGGVLGEAMWAAKQNLRIARAGGAVAEIHRATVLFIETTKAVAGVQEGGSVSPEAGGSGQEPDAPRGPGRPPNQPRQLRVDVAQMREALISKGINVAPAPEATQ